MSMVLSGHTQPFAVLGHPIGHSLSPIMHNASIQSLGLDSIYLAFDVDPAHLMDVLPAMRDMGFGGVNLTVPLKEVAFNGIADLGATARHMGAVNTIEFTGDGGIRGHNTDGYGFLAAMQEAFQCSPAGQSVFILGSGGAGRAVAITSAVEGASHIVLADLDAERTTRVRDEIATMAPETVVEALDGASDAWTGAAQDADLVIQATPVGMKPDDPPLLKADAFRRGQMLFDLVYMYPRTAMMQEAATTDCRTANGLDMLLYQGAQAFTIWTGKEPDVPAMRQALQDAVYG